MDTGGVHIAIIDSGVNELHSHVGWITTGVGLHRRADNQIVKVYGDVEDWIGHGTAIAGVIRQRIPHADLYVVKIFHSELRAPVCLLIAGLEWALAHRIKIIHLSLGCSSDEGREQITDLCRRAFEQGLVVVAAARSPDDTVVPSSLETVIGVYWDRTCGPEDLIYHRGSAIEFGTYGFPRPLPGISQERNFFGSSFAAAHVTARVGRLLMEHPNEGPAWVRQRLIEQALPAPLGQPSK